MFTIPTWLLATIVCALFVGTPVVASFVPQNKASKNFNKIASAVGIATFLALLGVLTLTETKLNFSTTTINFQTSSQWFSKSFINSLGNLNTVNAVVNAFMLAPIGVMASQNSHSKNKKHAVLKGMALGFATSVAIESLQWALPITRSPDFADICLNTLGAAFGATSMSCLYFVEDKIRNKQNNKALQMTPQPTKEMLNALSPEEILARINHQQATQNLQSLNEVHANLEPIQAKTPESPQDIFAESALQTSHKMLPVVANAQKKSDISATKKDADNTQVYLDESMR